MFLGIDVGTQSVKAILYDADLRRVIDIRSAPLRLTSTTDGARTQQSQWWITALALCLAGFNKTDRSRVKAIGVSGQQHGLVPLGLDDEVLAPVKLWCDTSTVAECAQITERFGGQARCIEEVGNAILPGYTAPKILWLKNNLPAAYSRLATIFLPHDYINFYLTGERAMECGDASGTGMFDIRQRAWHQGMLAAVDPDRDLSTTLPSLVAADVPMGELHAKAASALDLPVGVPVASGGGDNMMAAIGTGNVSPGRLTASLGTSGTLFANAEKPIIDPEGAVAAFCSSTGNWLPLFCTMNCTGSTELTRSLFSMSINTLEQRVAGTSAGSNGVMTLPFFNGERSPNLPKAKGCILGLDESNYCSDNLLRSAMESAVYGLRGGLDRFAKLGCEIDTVRLTGGGAGSAVWCQMIADIFNLPVSVQTVDEGAALGAALQALWMYQRLQGERITLQRLVDEHLTLDPIRACVPRNDSVQKYKEVYSDYLRHVEAITTLYN